MIGNLFALGKGPKGLILSGPGCGVKLGGNLNKVSLIISDITNFAMLMIHHIPQRDECVL